MRMKEIVALVTLLLAPPVMFPAGGVADKSMDNKKVADTK